ncbi:MULTISPECIES: metallophosphoesterase family protein [unclassified Bradyrhizobium]|uniref:metallophosphoesterase family protein n=1 Tax=unclassified Bradyrhizobium TaxID=2631580 RepID=UPI0024799F28|nr:MULTISPECIES: metallophosphoesterase family protein [unclassified Bradyrhizobium]WGR70446.1 metallophosphatase family protein [Bradyrhizobium sp. ISRA426]WGR82502.1 metallophosphatase family protein [Bradyrhizobium sp. ISRA430]WGR85688.1 metallophosphatase family protein [Bradyrhizobium sp. ISRA432]
MALYGILGDIHGNREALIAALTALDLYGPERLLCIGDIIGYNADSDECTAILRERGVVSIAGNHDLIGIGILGFERCSNKAMYALKRTRRSLRPGTVEYLRSLPRSLPVEDRAVLVHGGVRDVQQYMTGIHHIAENVAHLRADLPGRKICFYGHVHQQRIFEIGEGGDIRELPANGVVKLNPDREYFINPGSLDASRKPQPKLAEFALFDSVLLTIEFLRVSYDDALTEAKAAMAGYRIGFWRDRYYSWRRKLLGRS